MTNWAKRKIFIFQAAVFKFGDLLGGWKLVINTKFQHNISKIMPARPQKHRDIDCDTTIIKLLISFFSTLTSENIQTINVTENVTSLDAHWKPATTESLISLRYCTPLVQSITKLGPVDSGPKHQILRASVTS